MLDHLAMLTVQHPKWGVFDCKPLQVRLRAAACGAAAESCSARPRSLGCLQEAGSGQRAAASG